MRSSAADPVRSSLNPLQQRVRATSWQLLAAAMFVLGGCSGEPGDDDSSQVETPPDEDDTSSGSTSTPAATSTPGVTSTPTVTPDVTVTPVVTPDITATPGPTATPAVTPTDTPVTPTDTPATATPDTATPAVSPTPAGRAVFEVSPTLLSFTVESGLEETSAVTVTNTGDGAATVEYAVVSGEGFALADPVPGTLPALIEPGGDLELEVVFAPLVVADLTGSLEIHTDADNTPVLQVALRGYVPRCPNDPENDADGDGLCADQDNCPEVANEDQADADADGQGDTCDPCPGDPADDLNGDGVCGDLDNCPTANPDQSDTDKDGQGDTCDACALDPDNDSDADGVCADLDNCPDDSNPAQSDLDADGQGDACDACALDPDDDADGDGLCADLDNCPDASNPDQQDTDSDGAGDTCDACKHDDLDDQDGDGVCGDVDNCPTVSNPDQGDIDNNGVGNACSTEVCDGVDNDGNGSIDDGFADADRDGKADCVDRCPQDAQNDADSDGVCGDVDNCPISANADQGDIDSDDLGDACDLCPGDADNDLDADGVCGNVDNCPGSSNAGQTDVDEDGTGDACDAETCDGVDNDGDTQIDEGFSNADGDGSADCVDACPKDAQNDADSDGVCGDVDNCPTSTNPGQQDGDSDDLGDVCDLCASDEANDLDADGVCGDVDNCPASSNVGQTDTDTDGAGDACDVCAKDAANDADSDGVCGDVDNCPSSANAGQIDGDSDGKGDVCDACPADAANDADSDGVCGDKDNCPSASNPGQSDVDTDGTGDVCDTETCDGVDNDGDTQADEGFTDTDKDSKADCVDTDDDNDTVPDTQDTAPLDPKACGDSDADKCDDCAVAGQPTPGNDGADADGDGYCDLSDVPNGSSQLQAAFSCGRILDQGYSKGDGLYWLDPDSGSSSNAFQAWCDMTTDGGGWTLVAKLGESAQRIDDFSTDRDLGSLVNATAPTSTMYAHLDLGRFNAYGSSWQIATRVDSANNGAHYQFTYFQPKQGATTTAETAGSNWRGTSTASQLVYLNRSSTTGSGNYTWLAVDRFDDTSAGQPSMYFLGYRRADLGNQCLSASGASGQTVICHSPAGLVSNQPGLVGTYTAAFGLQDGVTHSWTRRATYWLRDATSRKTGSSALSPAASCKALYDAGSRTSGLYYIDPDGGSSANVVLTWCDQTSDGGGWTLGVNIASDLGAINLFTYTSYSSDPVNANYGLNMSGMGLSSSTTYRLSCVESSDGTSRKMFITGLNPAEPIFQAAGTITKTNIRCSQSADLSNPYTGSNCILGGYDDDNHTYYGNAAWDMDWALFKAGSAYTLRHCANRGGGYWNRGALWFR